MSDPDKGSWSYSYNPLGVLVSQTDAKGQTTRLSYDVLGRMLTRTDGATGASPQVSSWVYDTAAKGIGKLASETGYGYSASVTYDSLGRPSAKTETMDDGSHYTVTAGYDSYSRPATVAYPTGLTVQTAYTAYGQLAQLSNASTGAAYWTAVSVDGRGNVTGATYGNGVNLANSYDAASGHLTGIMSTSAAAGTIQNLSYQFDTLGNLLSRTDSIQAIQETFQYDTLNRVTSSTVAPTGQGSGGTTVSVAYDALGNITSKSDIGAYTYAAGSGCASNFAGPHAVSAVNGAKVASYCYDADGNLTQGDGRTVAWTAFNMPSQIQQNSRTVNLTYGPDRGRFKRVDLNETGTATTYYVAGGSHEVVESGTTVTHKTYIGGAAVVIEVTSTPASSQTIYLLHDHLGSTDVITDASGNVQSRYSFDAWGARRNVTWAAYFPTMPAVLWQTALTTRGFTGHEELDEVGLVHMNGRVYDPQLGRFLSADPVVQDATDLQAYNHYAYVRNNPLSLLDPSGFSWIGDVFKSIGNFFSHAFGGIASAFKAMLRNSIFRAVIQIAICAATAPSGPGICAAAAAGLTLAAGGTPLQALKAFAITFVSAEVWKLEGDWTTGKGFISSTGGGIGTSASTVLVHGVVGGALSAAQGGHLLQGFAAGAIGEIATIETRGMDFALRVAAVSAAGGLASQVTGGKFANGAITAAFAFLYNECGPGHGGNCGTRLSSGSSIDVVDPRGGNGTLFVDGFSDTTGGLSIHLTYMGDVGNAQWIQTITTDQPPEGATSPYVDPYGRGTEFPFYYTAQDNGIQKFEGGMSFDDAPQRSGPATWNAELSLVGRGADGAFQEIVTMKYGFTFSGGIVTLNPITLSTPSQFQRDTISGAK